jgi:hypothetical protein
LVRSLSFVGPALGEKQLQQAEAEIREAAERLGGAVWSREIRVAIARRKAALRRR